MKKDSIWRTLGIGILVFLFFEVLHYNGFTWKEWIVPGILAYITYRLIKHFRGNKALPLQVKVPSGEVKVQVVSPDTDSALLSQAELIINAYGKTLEYLAPGHGCVADEEKLPFSKAKIKAAIVQALRSTQDKHQQAMLKNAYLLLADFQPGVGSRNVGLDLSTIDAQNLSDAEVLALGATIIESAEEVKPWLAKASSELIHLVQELQGAGFSVASPPR